MTTDERLIIRLCNHDRQSLEELYNRYARLIWNVSYKSIADEAICEDIVKHVFQRVWKNPHEFNNGKKLSVLLIECCKLRLSQLRMPKPSVSKR